MMPSPDFRMMAFAAVQRALRFPDDAVRFMAKTIPIYAEDRPSPQMVEATGAQGRTLLGLWTSAWPGYENSAHGLIILFEDGIRKVAPRHTQEQVFDTLLHEFDHALQYDHVIDSMEAQKARGAVPQESGRG